MKRHTAVRIFSSCLEDNDIAFFIGKGLCNEAYKYHRPGNLYLGDVDYSMSTALGTSLGTDKRVFVFCEDQYVLRNLSELAQVAASRQKNFFCVLFVTGTYTETGNQPNIFDSVVTMKGSLFNLGFLVHDYTAHYKNTKSNKETMATWSRAKGPLLAMLRLDAGLVKNDLVYENNVEEFMTFVQNKDLGTSLYTPFSEMGGVLISEEK
jgi:hypothetical protein